MDTQVFLEKEALLNVIAGAEKVFKAVSSTMGPRGRNAIIRKQGITFVTRDGVTVAESIKLENRAEQAGAELIQRAASTMNELTGDGTTTVTVLTYRILEEANKLIAAGHNPMALKASLELALVGVKEYIESKTIKDLSLKQLTQVATIAASDKEIGKMIAETVFELGKDSMITLQDGHTPKTSYELVDGMQINSGYSSPYMITDDSTQSTSVKDAYVVLFDKTIRTKEEILPILKLLNVDGKPNAIVIAHEIAGDALSFLVMNRVKGAVEAVGINIPTDIEDKTNFLHDIAAVTGGKVISKSGELSEDNATLNDFGKIGSAVLKHDKTIITRGFGDKDAVDRRKNGLAIELADKTKHVVNGEERMAILEGRTAIITIGGTSPTDIQERHFRFEDAVGASKAAIRSGLTAGGGTTLLGASKDLGETPGDIILKQALVEPAKQVLLNAGLNAEARIGTMDYNKGYDVTNPDVEVDMLQAGVVDPAESTIKCLETAVSIACLLMTAGSLIVDIEKKQNEKA
jgi:chaperonin GroEL